MSLVSCVRVHVSESMCQSPCVRFRVFDPIFPNSFVRSSISWVQIVHGIYLIGLDWCVWFNGPSPSFRLHGLISWVRVDRSISCIRIDVSEFKCLISCARVHQSEFIILDSWVRSVDVDYESEFVWSSLFQDWTTALPPSWEADEASSLAKFVRPPSNCLSSRICRKG